MREQPVNPEPRQKTFFRPWPVLPIALLLLLAGSFLYVWLRVQPQLEYHSYGPYFLRQRAFLESFLKQPGGLANYAGVFLAQLNHSNLLGALSFVLSQALVFLVARFCVSRLSGRALSLLALIPPFILLVLRNRYGCPLPAITLGLLLALLGAALFFLVPWRHLWLAAAASGLVSALLFCLAGLWSALLFAVLSGLFAWGQMRARRAGFACLGLGLVGPLLAVGLGRLEVSALFNPWPGGVPWLLTGALYASVPTAGAILALLPAAATAAPTPAFGRWFQAPGRRELVALLAFLVGWAVLWRSFDERQKLLAKIDYSAGAGQYEAVLDAASQVRVLNDAAKIRVQLALYHTGRLADELFSFHNMVEEAPSRGVGEDSRAQGQSLFQIGLLNDAEHMAYEALEMDGERPDVLRLLARINFLKDRPQGAQVFLNVLSLIPFQGERANETWPAGAHQIPPDESALLARMRTQVLSKDVLHEGLPLGRLLEVVLASNPTNRMAFEYLMADCLLGLDLKNAAENLRFLENFHYFVIPRPYEEALLLFQQVGRVQVDLKGRKIRPETIERFRQFLEAARQYRGGTEEHAAMATGFGDTYWFYYYAIRARQRAAEAQTSAP
jgi:hypothetical protein